MGPEEWARRAADKPAMLKRMTLGAPAGKWIVWVNKHRREVLDLAALALSLVLVQRFVAEMPVSAALCAFLVASLVPLRPFSGDPGPWREFLAAVPRRIAAVVVTGAFLRYMLGAPLDTLWFGAIWPIAGLIMVTDWRRASEQLRSNRWIQNPVRQETLRSTLLFACTLWLMQGFFRSTLHGAADAGWYAMTLKDTVMQVRSGIFPIWTGQSIYQFNGAISPLRVAPAFQYLGALLDLITFRSLGIYSLQNLLLTLLALGGMVTSYLSLRTLLPDRKWLAAGLSVLFLSCPGVLGIPYNGDLYLSWTTLPLMPLVWFATVRSFQNQGKLETLVLLGAALGLCWWGHSPIALWSTFFAFVAQAVRMGVQWRDGIEWKAIFSSVGVFSAIAAYPIGSVLLYPAEPGYHADSFQLAGAGNIVDFLRETFPATILPISATGRSLGDFQLGYSLWALLLFSLWQQRGAWKWTSAVPLVCAGYLALLLLPIPGLVTALWTVMPAFLRNITGNWAMPRICLLLAAATVFGTAACASTGDRRRRHTFSILVAIGCVWSLSEAEKFAAGSHRSLPAPESAVDLLRPENVQLTRYSYGFFPHFPGTFTHSVANPELENCLLSADMSKTVAANTDAALTSGRLQATGDFHWRPIGQPNHAELDQELRIEPGRFYLLKFDFANPDTIHGVLELQGKHLFREYGLPEHGGPLAFGAGGTHSNVLPLWTTSEQQYISASFFPTKPVSEDQPTLPVAHVQLFSYDRAALPVQVNNWIPYKAQVKSPVAAWLETPRMYQPAYVAWVNHHPAEVRKSPDSLVSVAVPAGESDVELVYVAPTGLKLLFWLSLSSIAAATAIGVIGGVRLLLTGTPSEGSLAAMGA
jgi:hypothetical protein